MSSHFEHTILTSSSASSVKLTMIISPQQPNLLCDVFNDDEQLCSYEPVSPSDSISSMEVESPAGHVERPAHCARDRPVTKKQKLHTKQVTFSDSNDIIHYETPSDADIKAAWLQEEDKARIRLDCKLCAWAHLQSITRSKSLPMPSGCCVRGLEKIMTKRQRMATQQMRKEAVSTVLSAQRQTGSSYPEFVRLVALSRSRESVKEAIRVAEKDSRIWLEECRELL